MQLSRRRGHGAGVGGDRPGRVAPTRSSTPSPTPPAQSATGTVSLHDHPAVGSAAAGPARRGDDEPGPGRDGRRARQRHRPARPGAHGDVGRGGGERGSTATDGQQVTFTPSADFFGTTSFIYRVRDGANVAAREAEAQVTVTVIGQPSAPGLARRRRRQRPGHRQLGGSAVERRADRRLRAAHRRRRGAVGRQPDGLHVDRPDQRPAGAVQRARPQQRRLGPVERAVAGRHARHRAGSPGGAVRAVRRRRADRDLVAAGQRGQRDHRLRPADRRRGVGDPARRQHDDVPLGGPDERPGVHVHGAGRERQGRGPVQLGVGAGAPAAAARRAGGAGRRARRQDDQRRAGARRATAATRSSSTRCRSSRPGAVNTTTGTSLQWSNLPNGQPQQFRVRARNRAGWGPWSAASAPVVPCGVPDRAGGVTAQRADGAATVSWAAPGNQGCAITGYTITTNHGQSMNVGGGATSATFGGLTNGTTYTFTVAATNEVGQGAASPPSNAVVPAGPPGAPTITAATPDTGCVTVAWSGANPNGSPITTYQLSVNGGGWENVGGGDVDRRGPGWPTARRTRSRCGPSTTSAPGPAATRCRPARPASRPRSAASTSRRRVGGEIRATWSAPNDNGKPITRYEVDLSPGRRRQRDRPLAHVDRARTTTRATPCRSGPATRSAAAPGAARPQRPRPRGRWTSTGARTAPPSASRAAATRRAPGCSRPPPASTPARPTPSRATAPGRAPTRRPSAPPTATAGSPTARATSATRPRRSG